MRVDREARSAAAGDRRDARSGLGSMVLALGTGALFVGITGHPLLGLPLILAPLTLSAAWGWVRRERAKEREAAWQLLLMAAQAERARQRGEVHACESCLRPLRAQAQRCPLCGALRPQGLLR